jgi:uncharacterized membrane protein YgcG
VIAHRSIVTGVTLAAGLLLAAGRVGAQQGTDPRWLPWLGCWEAERGAGAAMLCVVPSNDDPGVELVSVERGQVSARELVRADGQARDAGREGCTGTESARFSEDGHRIYLEADHVCQGNVRQRTTGMLAMLSATEWIDVRASAVGEDVATGVSRYRLAPIDVADAAGLGNIAADRAMAVRAARVAAAARIGVADIIDASRNVDSHAVGAWIAERREPLRVEAAQLIQMADGGVTPDVIDVVVAVSYPRYFTLGEGAQVAEVDDLRQLSVPVGFGGTARVGRFFDPFYGIYSDYDRYYNNYYGNYYSPYGYGGRNGFGYGYPDYFRPTVVVVQPREENVTQGRVVNGRGYTRSRPTTAPSGTSSGSSSPSSAPSSGEPSSSGSGSSGGTSTGRTAMPRPPEQ